MEEWRVGSPGKACGKCAKGLPPSSPMYSAVRMGTEGLERQDFCAACGKPTEGFLSYWRTRTPDPPDRKKEATPGEVEEFFRGLPQDERGLRLRYVTALWLIRKRRLKLVERRGGASPELVLERTTDGERLHVAEPGIPPEELDGLVSDLGRVLGAGTEAPSNPVDGP